MDMCTDIEVTEENGKGRYEVTMADRQEARDQRRAFRRELRMERAKGLLESSFLSVKEIAFQVGLNDESHFVRDFKSTYGYSPAIYRLQFKRNGDGQSNGIGTGHGVDQPHNVKEPTEIRERIARAAKQSILPSLHLLVFVFSNM